MLPITHWVKLDANVLMITWITVCSWFTCLMFNVFKVFPQKWNLPRTFSWDNLKNNQHISREIRQIMITLGKYMNVMISMCVTFRKYFYYINTTVQITSVIMKSFGFISVIEIIKVWKEIVLSDKSNVIFYSREDFGKQALGSRDLMKGAR